MKIIFKTFAVVHIYKYLDLSLVSYIVIWYDSLDMMRDRWNPYGLKRV